MMQGHRQKPAMLLMVAALLLLSGSMLGFWLYGQFALRLNLVNQQGVIQLPQQIDANVAATNTFTIRMNGDVHFKAPIQQRINVDLQGNYPANIKLDTDVPIAFNLNYQGTVAVDTFTDVETTTALVAPHFPKLPLKIRIPLKFNVPMNMNVPVKTKMRFVYDGPVHIGLNQQIQIPLDMLLDSKIAIDREVHVPLLTSFNVQLYPDQQSIPVRLNSQMRVPFRQLGFVQQGKK
jgi:hypothetical protein